MQNTRMATTAISAPRRILATRLGPAFESRLHASVQRKRFGMETFLGARIIFTSQKMLTPPFHTCKSHLSQRRVSPVLTTSDLYFLTSSNERKCPSPPGHGVTHYSSHSRPRGPGQEMLDCQRRTENTAPGGARPSSWPCSAPLPQRGSGEPEAPAPHSLIHSLIHSLTLEETCLILGVTQEWSPSEVSSFSSLCFLEEAFPSPHYGGQSLEKWQLGFPLLMAPRLKKIRSEDPKDPHGTHLFLPR